MPAHAYRYPVDTLFTGTSLGNLCSFVKLTPTSDVAGVWSANDNEHYLGRWVTQMWVGGERAQPRDTIFASESQTTEYVAGPLRMRKRVFLPMTGDELALVYARLEVDNPTDQRAEVAIICDMHYPAFVWPGQMKVPEQEQRNKRVEHREEGDTLVSVTVGKTHEARAFRSSAPVVSTYASDRGFSRTFALAVQPMSMAAADFVFAYAHNGAEDVLERVRNAPAASLALAAARALYEDVHRTSFVRTPDPLINRALDWAKVNTVRVQHMFPAGFGFTNDPSQDIVVVRDAAWYALGSDYLTPRFSFELLDLVRRYGIGDGGKIVEYIAACADPPRVSDYDLNINDDTPLIVCAVYHHYAVTRDRAALERFWPMAAGACDWILRQIRGDLVYSHSQEANVWGIAGWRNIIPQQQISGAVTEVNAECCYALRLAAELARTLGHGELAERYGAASEGLRASINERLVSERTGCYLLNIDPDGVRHHDLTGDQIFPVLCGVADGDRKRRILELLYTPEFWTPFGVRTVGRNQEEYDPDHGVQLLGGVWPNLTAWVAYCSKSVSPRRLVSGMRNIWKISEVENPKAYQNVVPGLFPERLSGENFKSRGMAMSPWMPPTYLWVALEGLLGIEPSVSGIRINPHVPSEWRWLGVRDMHLHGGKLTAFYYRRTLYSNTPVSSRGRIVVLNDDVSHAVDGDAPFYAALRDERRTFVFVATDADGTYTLRLRPPIVEAEETRTFVLRAGDAHLFHVRRPTQRDARRAVAAR